MDSDLEQPKDTLIKRLSGRDVYAGLNRASINLTLDTSGEGLYGFWFGINLGDSLMDGTVLPEYRFSNEWDGPWRGASVETDNPKVFEIRKRLEGSVDLSVAEIQPVQLQQA